MARKSDREYELSASLMHADKRINMLVEEIKILRLEAKIARDLIYSLEKELSSCKEK